MAESSPASRAAPSLYFTPCAVCGAEFDQACRDAHTIRMHQPHKARYDSKARADVLAWKSLGAQATG
jgi:hypothetical protein